VKRCTYLLPIRRSIFREIEAAELRNYLSILAGNCELIVIDVSSSEIFKKHHRLWSGVCRHEVVDSRFTYLNDKVNGEDLGLRGKTTLFAGLLPSLLLLGIFCGVKWMSIFAFLIAAVSILVAFAGRARGNANQFFPFSVCFFAPLWIFERVVSTCWAFHWYLTRGGYPFGDRLLAKGIGRDWVEGGKIAASASSRQ
jgi:hypothetical protein